MELVKQLQGGETEFDVNEFQNMAAKTLGAFLEGEKYDFTRDLTDAYKSSMQTTTEEKIFNTIPDHVFWDIKTP